VVRIAVVVLSLFGGLGVLLYLIGAVWMPEPGDTTDVLSGRRLPLLILTVIAALLVLPGLLYGFGDGGGLLVLLAVVAIVALIVRRPAVPQRETDGATPGTAATAAGGAATAASDTPGTAATEAASAADGTAPDLPAYVPGAVADYGDLPYPSAPASAPPAAPYPPPAPRRRSYLGGIALCASLIWFGTAWLLNTLDVTSFSAVTIFGGSLLILALGILMGAWIGRARWLVLLALPLALVLWGLSLVPDQIRLDRAGDWVADGVGTSSFEPTSEGDTAFSLGIGEGILDLASFPADVAQIDASLGVGQLVIYVDAGRDVVVNAEAGFGSISRDAVTVADGQDLSERLVFDSPDPDAPTVTVDARVDLGEIAVITTPNTTPDSITNEGN
jgi:hypothetical protein